MNCKNCGHIVIEIDGDWIHNQRDAQGRLWRSVVCELCGCKNPEPRDGVVD